MVARAPGVGRRRGNGGAICHGRGMRWAGRFAGRRRLVEFLIKSFEHAGGLLAARDAEIEPLLLLQEEDVRIVLAVIAALAAILLSHRRHHPPPQRPAVGKLHALGERQRLVVPRRLPVVAVIDWSVGGGISPDISAAFASGEKAVMPAPSSSRNPARKPLSHVRCSAVNGALSGTNFAIGGCVG